MAHTTILHQSDKLCIASRTAVRSINTSAWEMPSFNAPSVCLFPLLPRQTGDMVNILSLTKRVINSKRVQKCLKILRICINQYYYDLVMLY